MPTTKSLIMANSQEIQRWSGNPKKLNRLESLKGKKIETQKRQILFKTQDKINAASNNYIFTF